MFYTCAQMLRESLMEALVSRDLSSLGDAHRPAIDMDSPTDKVLKLIDKLIQGDLVGTALSFGDQIDQH